MEKKNLKRKYLAILILLALIFLGTNLFKDNLVNLLVNLSGLNKSSEALTAELLLEEQLQELREMRPLRNKDLTDLEISARAGLAVLTNSQHSAKKLFTKANDQKLPIASLAKLMTSWVVLEHYDLSQKITISSQAAGQMGNNGKLKEGETFSVEYFLYHLLMESSNAAAYALTNDYPGLTQENFMDLMNSEAAKMRLVNTFFYNPSGLDPQESAAEKINYSTAEDLIELTKNLLTQPLIWEILSLPTYSLYGPELINTNKFLLNNSTDWQERIVGGKTGYTSRAGGCLLLVLKAPKDQGYLINVILGADGPENRFEEMKKLVDWLKIAYRW